MVLLAKYMRDMFDDLSLDRDFGLFAPLYYPRDNDKFADKIENNTYYINYEIPGLSEKDVKVEVLPEERAIKITGKSESKDEKSSFFVSKSFSRTVTLPQNIKSLDEISAEIKNGVLAISIPLEEKKELTSRTIPIKLLK